MTDEVDRLLKAHGWSDQPEDLIGALCRELLEEAGASIPVNVRALASLRGALVEEVDQPVSGWIGPVGERLVIRVRASDLEARRRFTVCHEICHTFFPDFAESPRERAEPQVERFDERDPVEYLCDVGAAELLLPREPFGLLLPNQFTIENLIRLASHFRASIEAAARRAVLISEAPVAAIVLEPHSGELGVRWSASNSMTAVSRSVRIPATSPLARLEINRGLRYESQGELTPDNIEVEARLLPYPRNGVTVGRVLALVRPIQR